MSKRTAIERLARDICWRGFSLGERKRRKGGKTAYWLSITPTSRDHYRCQARTFIWLLSMFSAKEIAALPPHHPAPPELD